MKMKISADNCYKMLLIDVANRNKVLFFGSRTEFDRFKPNMKKKHLVLYIGQFNKSAKIRKSNIFQDFKSKNKHIQEIYCSLVDNTLFIKNTDNPYTYRFTSVSETDFIDSFIGESINIDAHTGQPCTITTTTTLTENGSENSYIENGHVHEISAEGFINYTLQQLS